VAPADLGYLLLLGLVVLPVSFYLISLGPRFLPAPEVHLVLLLEIPLGPYWVWLALGEAPDARAFAGGAVVIAALAGHSVAAMRSEQR
jgi:drug/metabolite transporter (DMT)-like permease